VTTDEANGRYGGSYVTLIKRVLPIASEIIGQPRAAKLTNSAVGKRAQRVLKRLEKAAARRRK
jgi:hypothetical protein